MILDFFNIAANLKTIPRQGWIDKISIQNPESVADHTYSMAIIGMILSDSNKYDTEKILKMILLHDLAESITGDFTPEQKSKQEKTILENKTIKNIVENLPKILQKQYLDLWDEYQKNDSKEANLIHQIDKLEMAIQAKIYSEQNNSTQKLQPFFDSAQKEITDPDVLKLFNQLQEKK
ncbi:MAG: HD domain-containing protein [Nitrosopumilus sp.]|nr:HD domain-containing protein [Nitrosopumilus sp.]